MSRRQANDAVRLGQLLGQAWHAFSRLGQARFADAGLSAARVRLLLALADEPGERMGDLAQRLGVTARAITPITDALVADGLIRRVVDPADRRAFRLELTEAGTGQATEMRALRESVSEEVFHALDAGQRQRLAALLSSFIESCGDRPGEC